MIRSLNYLSTAKLKYCTLKHNH